MILNNDQDWNYIVISSEIITIIFVAVINIYFLIRGLLVLAFISIKKPTWQRNAQKEKFQIIFVEFSAMQTKL